MPGIADIALGAAPIAGGAMLGLAAGGFGGSKGPDVRGLIKQDQDLLERIPPEQAERRAGLQRTIDTRIDDMIAGFDRNRQLRKAAASYRGIGNWRDIVVFICAVLFTIVWWNVPHSRSNWQVMFIFLIILTIVLAVFASRGVINALTDSRIARNRSRHGSSESA